MHRGLTMPGCSSWNCDSDEVEPFCRHFRRGRPAQQRRVELQFNAPVKLRKTGSRVAHAAVAARECETAGCGPASLMRAQPMGTNPYLRIQVRTLIGCLKHGSVLRYSS